MKKRGLIRERICMPTEAQVGRCINGTKVKLFKIIRK